MIGYLAGQPVLAGNHLIVLTGGVGYEVVVHPQLLNTLTQQAKVELYIHTYVREDRLELYGFGNLEDRTVFRMLIDISGVGPKTAIQMFAQGSPAIIDAVQQADLGFFKSIPRVGKKVAQKIIIELKPKLGNIKELNLKSFAGPELDLFEALLSLGFEETKIKQVMEELDVADLGLEKALKSAMKRLTTPR